MAYENPKIDFICQHCKDGSIIPLRFRVDDEDGVQQEFTIKGYKNKSECGLVIFDCNVIIHNTSKVVRIFTSPSANDGIWYLKTKG